MVVGSAVCLHGAQRALAPRIGVHLTVPVLAGVAGLLIVRASRDDKCEAACEDVDMPREVALAA